ncbi:unnamed protein product [Vitrella brassicaformis CCMP3155]|uniref:Uncharacterized protein n=1 Tax=Vitrella brassicaformis (strain CCMP3155) TaxID=1169540 RepID=A0A0G4EN57_VITBC|nr:unnamed protein product [Vitrella brassicaformis CCMP3155]|eukprot:CEL98266.1 unnamed protein product [Vitrella brassicaformis CCMP3155]
MYKPGAISFTSLVYLATGPRTSALKNVDTVIQRILKQPGTQQAQKALRKKERREGSRDEAAKEVSAPDRMA